MGLVPATNESPVFQQENVNLAAQTGPGWPLLVA
jgi:hypothetical protein